MFEVAVVVRDLHRTVLVEWILAPVGRDEYMAGLTVQSGFGVNGTFAGVGVFAGEGRSIPDFPIPTPCPGSMRLRTFES